MLVRLHTGEEHSIAHLAPMMISCPCEPIGRDLSVRVGFKNHCYTEAYDAEEHEEAEILIREGSDVRVFCPIRYGLSKKLPGLVSAMPSKKVHQTGQSRNYVFVVPLEVEKQHYEIYFMLQRAAKDDAADLRLTIESAYANGGHNVRKRPRTIRFAVLAHKVLTNQVVRFAPR